jgi:hypothetical protein
MKALLDPVSSPVAHPEGHFPPTEGPQADRRIGLDPAAKYP